MLTYTHYSQNYTNIIGISLSRSITDGGLCMVVTALSNYGPLSWFLRWIPLKIGFSHRICISKKLQLASTHNTMAESKRYLRTSRKCPKSWHDSLMSYTSSKTQRLISHKKPIRHTHTTEIRKSSPCTSGNWVCTSLKQRLLSPPTRPPGTSKIHSIIPSSE